MAIRYAGNTAMLDGQCAVEDAGELAEWLIADATRAVDLAACEGVHTAVLQCLMALRPPLAAAPADPTLARWLGPLLPPQSEGPHETPRRRRSSRATSAGPEPRAVSQRRNRKGASQ
jgi:hypothetical protein